MTWGHGRGGSGDDGIRKEVRGGPGEEESNGYVWSSKLWTRLRSTVDYEISRHSGSDSGST